MLRFVPLIANNRAFVVVNGVTAMRRSIRCWDAVVGYIRSVCLALRRDLRRIRMRKVRFTSWEGKRKFSSWVDVADEYVGQRFVSRTTRVPGLDDARYLVDPWHGDGGASF